MSKDTETVNPAVIDEEKITEEVRTEIDFIEKRRAEVKSANKEVSAAFDRLDSKGLDKKAIKAYLQRKRLDEEQRKRFDRTIERMGKIFADQIDMFDSSDEPTTSNRVIPMAHGTRANAAAN